MTNAQKWTTIILSFILVFTIVAGGFTYAILSSPAATTEFDIYGNFNIDNELNGANLTITHVYGKVNSKTLGLILLAIHSD